MENLLTEDQVKQLFFYSDRKRPDALLADEVDIVQFAHVIEQFVARKYARLERDNCVKVVRTLNPVVADALERARQI